MSPDDFSDRLAETILILGIIAVIVLKLVGIITLEWIWLLSPIWILFGLGLILLVILITIIMVRGFYFLFKERKNERN